MTHIHELVARAQLDARIADAQQRRSGHEQSRALRSSRRAERLAQQARLAIARTL